MKSKSANQIILGGPVYYLANSISPTFGKIVWVKTKFPNCTLCDRGYYWNQDGGLLCPGCPGNYGRDIYDHFISEKGNSTVCL